LGRSWIAPDAKDDPKLLFVSDAAADVVYIVELPELTGKGVLKGFSEPQGECSDLHGNVWIANTQAEETREYSHGGKHLATLSDQAGYPVGCAIDPTSGNLAVLNIDGISGSGQVLIYPNASGTPTIYQVPGFSNYYFGGYDTAGDLFVDGRNGNGAFVLGELPKGSSTAESMTVKNASISFPGFVQWYRRQKYLAVADQLCGATEGTCIYWLSISGATATATASLTLTNYEGGPVCDMVQGVSIPSMAGTSQAETLSFAVTPNRPWTTGPIRPAASRSIITRRPAVSASPPALP